MVKCSELSEGLGDWVRSSRAGKSLVEGAQRGGVVAMAWDSEEERRMRQHFSHSSSLGTSARQLEADTLAPTAFRLCILQPNRITTHKC